MNERNVKILCLVLLIIGLAGFILQVFIFEKPDGNLGFILGMIEVACISGGVTKLCQLSKEFKKGLFEFLKIIFRF